MLAVPIQQVQRHEVHVVAAPCCPPGLQQGKEKLVDADFFNAYEDDFDEDDMAATH